jgi:hypothetical protein
MTNKELVEYTQKSVDRLEYPSMYYQMMLAKTKRKDSPYKILPDKSILFYPTMVVTPAGKILEYNGK